MMRLAKAAICCSLIMIGAEPFGYHSCQTHKRRRHDIRCPKISPPGTHRSWDTCKLYAKAPSSDPDDDNSKDDNSDMNNDNAKSSSTSTPVFPHLSSPPSSSSSSYDDAADALLRGSGGRSSSGERSLSSSEQIRNAVQGGDILGALAKIKQAKSPGGDWYDEKDSEHDDGGTGDDTMEPRDVVGGGISASSATSDATGGDKKGGGDATASDLTNIDYLLGRLREEDKQDEGGE